MATYELYDGNGNVIESREIPLSSTDIDMQIIALESKITARRLREAILTGDRSFIANIDAQIATLRLQYK